ncbi:hypothetical protein KAR29_02475 [Aminithiophilus ramosus]|uniref:NurA domain-containing protein n=2 Tax=Synergistales TaxID=649776 RepID=A0A9Q7EZ95_9BACT|nr:hypothetical protein [Aminithiophilus ramosus]QTX32816.1 hypothetical protein KAR29_02475 [Aminithiophilus ramosus]QVL36691.1 hypothetical protein KIH16_02465 [Synergistota bacterium]
MREPTLLPFDEAVAGLLADQSRLARQERDEEAALAPRLDELGRLGAACFLPVRRGERALWGVDGGLARERRLGDTLALLSVAAVAAEEKPRALAEVLRISHDGGAEVVLRARMTVLELLTARRCVSSGWVLLDGSFSSGLVAVSQALEVLGSEEGRVWRGLLDELLPAWIEALEELVSARLPLIALPKLTSGTLLARRLDLKEPLGDRALLSHLLPPGHWISRDRLCAFLGESCRRVRTPRGGQGFLDGDLRARLDRASTELGLVLSRGYYRPDSGGTVVEFETTSDEEGAVSALAGQFPTERLMEPLLLLAADEAAKGLCRLLAHFPRGASGASYRSAR